MRRQLVGTLVSLGLTLSPLVADACGGCFSPPTLPQVVTEHRMVLSVSAEETTLWDQFRFSGRPEEFSWILPIRFTDAVRVSVGSDAFVAALASVSAPTLTPPPYPWPACPYNPPPYCPPPPSATMNAGGFADASADALAADSPGAWAQDAPPPVQVLRDEVVGPFEVRVIRGEDPMAIRVWLQENGYNIPAAIEPVIDHYTGLAMDYLALRLRPEVGVDRIAPVRVTFPGSVPRLPLRMIAAGVGDRVGLRLFVLSQGRMEAANFPNDEYRDDDFVYDWSNPGWGAASQIEPLFTTAFTRRREAQGARLWLTEASDEVTGAALENFTAPFERVAQPDAGAGDGGVARALPSDDLRVALARFGGRARLTRLRADFPGAMLDRDLELAASDRGVRPRRYGYGRQINIPPPPVCPDGSRYDPALRRFVGARPWPPCPTYPAAPATHETVVESHASCAAGPTSSPRARWSLAALVALTALGRRRRRTTLA